MVETRGLKRVNGASGDERKWVTYDAFLKGEEVTIEDKKERVILGDMGGEKVIFWNCGILNKFLEVGVTYVLIYKGLDKIRKGRYKNREAHAFDIYLKGNANMG